MVDLLLRPPTRDDEEVVRGAHAMMAEEGFTFALFLDDQPSFAAWLDRIGRLSEGEVDGRLVRSDLLLAEVDGDLVGRTSIRYELNDFLRREGGHVGYGVLPAHRRRGYATQILQLSLGRLADRGVREALVTCDADNVGSATLIEAAGGTIESVVESEEGAPLRRYWVPTARSEQRL